ncbi:neuroguidin [Iris pallida]|uniref:Neuroguidin n=1 Tax=Iris pallida TaxID=29817 RepID=A0AAX6GH32_IRIPA|nr:neuroguidin [Iris pallida]
MDATNEPPIETLTRDAPQLVSLLKEMKDGLDAVRSKVQALTIKVKENQLLTADGMSYLETKHLLLLSYCQSIVYYLLRKAKGLSIEGHPVVRSLVEIRLFLEKIRPIDKKMEYQVQKLMKAAGNIGPEKEVGAKGKKKEESLDEEDPLKYRPNPDMLISKTSLAEQDGGVYRPPKFAPTTMDEENVDKMTKEEKHAKRWEKEQLRRYKRSTHLKEIMDDFQDKPEEVEDIIGPDSREFSRYRASREEEERLEEENFTRAPVTKRKKKLERHLLKSRNGLAGLTDGFDEAFGMFSRTEKDNDNEDVKMSASRGRKKFKPKRRH